MLTISGGNDEGVTPVPIPNTEVKPFSADGTWLVTARESRSPPDPNRSPAIAGDFSTLLGSWRTSSFSIVAAPHRGDCSFSNDLTSDEISATGGCQRFVPRNLNRSSAIASNFLKKLLHQTRDANQELRGIVKNHDRPVDRAVGGEEKTAENKGVADEKESASQGDQLALERMP